MRFLTFSNSLVHLSEEKNEKNRIFFTPKNKSTRGFPQLEAPLKSPCEMAAFAQFASDLDKATQRLLARGERLTALLKQPQYTPYPMQEQVISIFAGVKGYLDKIEIADIRRFETEMLATIRRDNPDLLERIREQKDLTPEIEKELTQVLDRFVSLYA